MAIIGQNWRIHSLRHDFNIPVSYQKFPLEHFVVPPVLNCEEYVQEFLYMWKNNFLRTTLAFFKETTESYTSISHNMDRRF